MIDDFIFSLIAIFILFYFFVDVNSDYWKVHFKGRKACLR